MYGIIYCAENIINKKCYVGFTTHSLEKRKREHSEKASNGRGYYFHNALRKYGLKNFVWRILSKENTKEALHKAEMKWIEQLKTVNREHGYNCSSGGRGGGRPNKETREKLSKILTGRKRSAKECRNISEAHKGIRPSKETKRKMSESHRGKNVGKANGMFGKIFSEEHRQKLSESHRGKSSGMKGKIPWNKGKRDIYSDESLKKMSESKKGQIFSETARENMRKAAKNRSPISEETRKKISQSKMGEKKSNVWKRYFRRTSEKIE